MTEIDVSAFRSKLLLTVPDTLGLTLQDIKECNWKTQKSIFSCILLSSPRYRDPYGSAIMTLDESRSRKLGFLRNIPESREDRKQIEADYRHSFLNVVLNACSEMAWPPTKEAFSNPLALLTDDIQYKLSAMSHLLDCGFPTNSNIRAVIDSPKQDKRLQSSGDSISDSPHYEKTQSASSKPTLQTTDRVRSSTNRSIDNNKMTLDTSNISVSSSSRRVSSPFVHQNSMKQNQSTQESLNDIEVLQSSNEMLKYHNEQLLKQLKTLQDAVLKRNDAESRMELLIRDLSEVVKELVPVQSKSAAVNESSPAPKDDSSVTSSSTKPESQCRSKSASRGNISSSLSSRLTNANRRTSGNVMTEKTTELSGNSAATIQSESTNKKWSQVYSKLRDISSSWSEARREARRAVFKCILIQPSTSQQFCKDVSNKSSTTIINNNNNHTNSTSKSKLIDSKDSPRWDDNFLCPSNDEVVKSSNNFVVNEINFLPSHKISMHKLLGLKPALCENSDFSLDVEGVALDVCRVHQLQNDLLSFSKSALSTLHAIPSINANMHNANIPLPPPGTPGTHASMLEDANTSLAFVNNLENLRIHCRQLFLRCACLSPVAAISAAPPLKSSLTGLECLIDLSFDILGKKITPDIILAAQRAKSEQQAALWDLYLSESCVRAWCQRTTPIATSLNNFDKKVNSDLRVFQTELGTMLHDFGQLVEHLKQAENCRIASNSRSFTSTPSVQINDSLISPLDLLAKGYMGEQVANLINSLRLHISIFEKLTHFLKSTKVKFHQNVTEELQNITRLGNSIYDTLKSYKV